MKKYLSDRVNRMEYSATLAMAAKTRELKNQGKDIIGLSLGEPDFEVPDFIKQEAIRAIGDVRYSKYSAVDGYMELREAASQKFKRDNSLSYSADQIVISTGAKQCLSNVALAMLNKGDEVIFPAPYWVSYAEIVKLADGVPVEVKTSFETDFKMTAQQLEKAITPKTKMLWINSPCNPSGSVYTKGELEALAEVLRRHPGIFVLSDEIYEHINFSGSYTSFAQIEGMYDRTITVNGVSKAFAMTGWRIGYMGSTDWIAQACGKVQGQLTSCTNTIAQRAAIVALRANPSQIKYMVDEFKNRRDMVLGLLRDIDGIKVNEPKGAFYLFPDVSSFYGKTLGGTCIKNSNDMAMYILENAGVSTVAGDAFGDDNCIRISYAASEKELREALRRIKQALK